MAINSRVSGLVQSVKPYVVSQSKEITGYGTSADVVDLEVAAVDRNSAKAIPILPTTEAPYDGLVAFGVFEVDPALDG